MAKRRDLQDLTIVSNNAGNAGDDGLCKFESSVTLLGRSQPHFPQPPL